MRFTRDYRGELERWLERAAIDPAAHSENARASMGFNASWRPALFGAGALGRVAASGLRKCGIEPLCFVDNNPRRWGAIVDGIGVISLAEAVERFGRQVPIVVTVYTGASLVRTLRDRGLSAITFPQLALGFQDFLLPWNALELPGSLLGHRSRIFEACSLWEDDVSRDEYVAQVGFRATFTGELPAHLPAESTYFPDELVTLKQNECFVDCGAYDGDSVDAFLRRSGGWFEQIVAIEPDPTNAEKLRNYVKSLESSISSRVRVVQSAVGATATSLRFGATGTVASGIDNREDTIEVPCARLDDLLEDHQPSYIKMDLEGAEPGAIAGAARIVERHAPVMAICLYHRQSDLWDIPLQVRALTDRYRLFLRRHSDDCWEQVLYAVPRERIRTTGSA